MTDARVEMYRRGMKYDKAYKKLLGKLVDNNQIMLRNNNDGEEARLSKSSVGKLMSKAAVKKSTDNGFAEKQHYAVVSDIDNLFKRSVKILSHADKYGNPDVTIHRFAVPLCFEDAVAYITIKESCFHGKRIYSAELIKIGKLVVTLEEAGGNPLTHFPAPNCPQETPGGMSEEALASSHNIPSPGSRKLGGKVEDARGNSSMHFLSTSCPKNSGGQMPDVIQTPRLNVRNAYATTPVNGGGQVLDGSRAPKHHVRNELAATSTDNVICLQEEVNTQINFFPNINKKESL